MTKGSTAFDRSVISRNRACAATSVARLETDEQSARRIAALFAEGFACTDVAVAVMDNGRRRCSVAIHFGADRDRSLLRGVVETAAGRAAAQALSFERIAAQDWAGESLAALEPVKAGRFVVHGAHNRARVPVNRIGVEIEAALAFGTGHHGTTRGCLLALDRICKTPGKANLRILDLGTGSGVLAIAAARLLHRRVLATDIDARAAATARANARLNRVAPIVEVVKTEGVAGRVRARAPFDLILANILLRPLQRFAVPLRKMTAAGGRVVLSGLLSSQASAAIAAYRGLALERRIEVEGWATLVLARRAAVARRRSAQ